MRRLWPATWSNAPSAIIACVVLLLIAGFGIIAQNEAAYRDIKVQEVRVQAEILAASRRAGGVAAEVSRCTRGRRQGRNGRAVRA